MNSKESTKDGIGQLRVLARKFYAKVPLRFRWIASPLNYCDRLFLDLRLKIWLVKGNELTSRMPLSVLCAGNDDLNMKYILELIFGPSFQKQYLGSAWLWKFPKVFTKIVLDYSLILINMRKSCKKLLRHRNWFYIPNWVIGEVDIPAVPNSRNLRRDLRKISKHSFRFVATCEPQEFDDFYHNMHVPYINKVYGSTANIVPYKEKIKIFKNCDLLLVKKQEESIAGILIAYENGGSRLWTLGIRNGNLEYVKEGALTALYHFSFLYLKDKGFTKVNFGLSRAFLGDGVFQYKKKWSQRIVGTSTYWYALKVNNPTVETKSFLKRNQFIFEKTGLLCGVIFGDIQKPLSIKQIRKLVRNNFIAGLSRLFICNLNDDYAFDQENLPPDLADLVVLCNQSDINLMN